MSHYRSTEELQAFLTYKEEIMHISNTNSLPTYDDSPDVEEILRQQDGYILALARKKVSRNGIHPGLLDLEIDELAQNIRIKLWCALQKTQIIDLQAYIRCIAYTESVNLVRKRKFIVPLPEDKDGELFQGDVLVMPSEGMQDPSWEFEQKELMTEYMNKIVDAVVMLPPRQQEAMICSLNDQIDDSPRLLRALRHHEIDIEMVNWPEEKTDEHRLKASLSFGRKKLRTWISNFVDHPHIWRTDELKRKSSDGVLASEAISS